MNPEGANEKRELRATVRKGRAALGETQSAVSAKRITERLRDLILERGASRVTCYLPVRGEPDTRGFIGWAAAHGVEVLLPAAKQHGLLEWILPHGTETTPGAFGIDEPHGEVVSPQLLASLDLMLIPAAAIDRDGHRLGWGRGYFDRCLASLAPRPEVFAIVHDHELVERVPREDHDVPVDGVVTPERTLLFPRHPA